MGMPSLLKAVEKVDDLTVKFVLNQPEAPFIADLGMDFASILSAEYAQKMLDAGTPEKVDLDPVGTGPFQLVAYQKDAVIRYKANPDYWAGKAAIDDLVFAITPDPSVRWQKLQANECQVMAYPNPADLDAIRANPDVNLLEQEGLNVGYLAFNTEKEPFTDKRVRQALNMAINKQAILDAVFQGAGTIAKNPIPPTMWSYNDAVKDYPYDPDAAKKLLAEAGHPDGFKTNIWAMPVQRPYNPNARRMAELIQADWAKVGVQAEIVSYEWGEYLKRSKEGEHQTMLLGWTGDNGDPDNFLYVLLGCAAAHDGTNRARWCYQPFDDLLVKAKRDQRRRRAHEAVRAGPGDLQGGGALGHDRPLDRLRAVAQGGRRLQDRPPRHPHLLRRRPQELRSTAAFVAGATVAVAPVLASRAITTGRVAELDGRWRAQ